MKHIVLQLIGAIAFLSVHAQSTFTLEEAILYGVQNNARIKTDILSIDDAEAQILEYKSIGIPKLDANINYNYYLNLPTQLLPDFITPAVYGVLFQEGVLEQRDIPVAGSTPVKFGKDHNINASLDFSAMIFDGVFLQGLKAQRMFRDYTERQIEITEYEIKANVTRAYLAVLIAQRNLELLNNNIRNLENLLRETRAIFESGFAEKLDVERLELSLDNLQTEYTNVERLIDVGVNLLKYEMGYPMQDALEMADNFEKLVAEVYLEKVETVDVIDYFRRPEYRSIIAREELSQINQKVVRNGYLPTVYADASYTQTLQRDDLFESAEGPWFPISFIGVRMTMPIFDGLNKKARLDRAKITTNRIGIQKSDFEQGMTLAVQNGRISYDNARELVESRRKSLALAQKIYDTTQIKYREGVGSSIELTAAESDLYEAQSNFIRAMYELVVAKTDLEIALGII